MCVAQPCSPGDVTSGAGSGSWFCGKKPFEDEIILITPRVGARPRRPTLVIAFTDSESNPSGVTAQLQHVMSSSLSSNTKKSAYAVPFPGGDAYGPSSPSLITRTVASGAAVTLLA